MFNHEAEWGSEHSALPGIMPSILLTRHLITSVLAFIITSAKPDFAPFEDSGSSNRSIIISQNNYEALKERGKKSSCWILLPCDRNMPAVGTCCVKQHFMAVSCPPFVVVFVPISRSGSQGAPPSSPVPVSPFSRQIQTPAPACMRHMEKS